MQNRNQAGRATGPLVLLLLVLCAGGAWNYQRNLQVEKATGPYKGYSVEELTSLRDAYTSELRGVRAHFDSAKRNRARSVGDVGSIAGNVEQFQQTTRASHAIRTAAASVVEREKQITELDRELKTRLRFGEGLGRHLKLLMMI